MAYADQKMSSRRFVAIIVVGVLHVGLAYALISGLAVSVVRNMQEDLNVFDVEEEPPPPEEEPPPPPPDTPIPPPPVQVSQPPIRTPSAPVFRPPPPVFRPIPRPAAPAPPPPPPPPPPPSQASPAAPRGNPGGWVTTNDYPSASLRAGEQGTTGFRLSVGADGRVADCTITSSSGHARLDAETCRQLQRRARFNPAQNDAGNATSGTYSSSVRWEIPD